MGVTALHEDAGILVTLTGSSQDSRRRKHYSNNRGDYHTNEVCRFFGLRQIRLRSNANNAY